MLVKELGRRPNHCVTSDMEIKCSAQRVTELGQEDMRVIQFFLINNSPCLWFDNCRGPKLSINYASAVCAIQLTQSQWVKAVAARTIKFNYLAHSFQDHLRDVLCIILCIDERCACGKVPQSILFTLHPVCSGAHTARCKLNSAALCVRFNQSLSKSFFNLSEQRAWSLARRADGESCIWKLIALLSVHFTLAYDKNFSGINWIRAPCLVININSKPAWLFSLNWFASFGNKRTHENIKILFIIYVFIFFIEFEQRDSTSKYNYPLEIL